LERQFDTGRIGRGHIGIPNLCASIFGGVQPDKVTSISHRRYVRRHQWRSLATDETIEATLDWLEDEVWLCSEATGGTGPGSGRRTRVTALSPRSRASAKGVTLELAGPRNSRRQRQYPAVLLAGIRTFARGLRGTRSDHGI
jgi:hypothetical protein